MTTPALPTSIHLDLATGTLSGEGVTESARTIGGLAGYFRDEAARAAMDQETLVYSVQSFEPEPEGKPGGLCCATTALQPGLVGDEYFLTRGHYHWDEDLPELELVISGHGLMVLMDCTGATWTEELRPGALLHVPPSVAHRAANTGDEPLVFVSFWSSETGHDYSVIAERGFGARVRRIGGIPTLAPEPEAGAPEAEPPASHEGDAE